MQQPAHSKSCIYCGSSLHGNYCSFCGRPSEVKRISLSGLAHEVVHLFTHYEKGFLYTVRELAVRPGSMQRAYMHGRRANYQKPFSMFFICASVAALIRYWVFSLLIKYYDLPIAPEARFTHDYMVLLQVILLPVYAAMAYAFFTKSGYNFAEFGVLMMYTMSFLFLLITVVTLLKFVWPTIDTAYIELPIWLIYTIVTFANFITNSRKIIVIAKTLVMIILQFMLIQFAEDVAFQLTGS